MAIITYSECLLLSCSGCGEQRLVAQGRMGINGARGEAPRTDHPDLLWRQHHDRCAPRRLIPPPVERSGSDTK
jgi:hypothetical protein